MVPVPLPKKITAPKFPNPVLVPQHCQQTTGTGTGTFALTCYTGSFCCTRICPCRGHL
jgi:hypothetical protein